MNRQDMKQVVFVIIVILGAAWWYGARHDGDASPLAGSPHASGLTIEAQSLKSTGTGDGSLYDYVTIKNSGTSFKSYVGLKGVCMNAAGTVVGDGLGNTANVGPGEETVITMIFLNVPDCDHVTIQFDALTN
jgi:hypothetical protein